MPRAPRIRPRLSDAWRAKKLQPGFGDAVMSHEIRKKIAGVTAAGSMLASLHPSKDIKRFGQKVMALSKEYGDWSSGSQPYLLHQFKVGVFTKLHTRPKPEDAEGLKRIYVKAERLRERAWKLYKDEPIGEHKDYLKYLHHDLAALTNTLDHLAVHGSEDAVKRVDIQNILETTGKRKFRDLQFDVRVNRSIPKTAEFGMDKGTMALLLDNVAENAEKASRDEGGHIDLKVSRMRNGRLRVGLRNRVRDIDEQTFRQQRRFYVQGYKFKGAFPASSGTGIVYKILDLYGGKARVSRRRTPDKKAWNYYFTAEMPLEMVA